ncbi:MAG: YjbE family putative metal transport protein [Candidatus Symbiobacter sp.]|nr:YjbE family putative metal transport protein [Candidatus Symbiobacter sp.]
MIDSIDLFLGLQAGTLTALFSVIVSDIVLAADNAMVIALAASRLDPKIRARAILYGIIGAAVMRIGFALVAYEMLQIVGLTLAGGLLLLWVGWKFWREIEEQRKHNTPIPTTLPGDTTQTASASAPTDPANGNLRSALTKILVADVSMSLENVLAVAGAARDHWVVMIIGLAAAVLMVGGASMFFVRILKKYYFLTYVGLAVIIWIALRMIYDGGMEVLPYLQ